MLISAEMPVYSSKVADTSIRRLLPQELLWFMPPTMRPRPFKMAFPFRCAWLVVPVMYFSYAHEFHIPHLDRARGFVERHSRRGAQTIDPKV